MIIKFKGAEKIIENLKKKLKRVNSNKQSIFGSPINDIVSKIKQELSQGAASPEKFNRIYTKNLYNNTRKEVNEVYGGTYDFTLSIRFGYFVNYGSDLEFGSKPKFVRLSVLKDWVEKKRLTISPFLVQKKLLKEGNKAYPIIKPIWEAEANNYRQDVLTRLVSKWR